MTRLFNVGDAPACLTVFDSNVPRYFGTHERVGFSDYLGQPARCRDYLVVERHGRAVACGGLMMDDDFSAAFCWGMVERALHHQGLGTLLTTTRLAQARVLGARRVTLSTSQHTQQFYARHGFTITRVIADGHGPGLDAVEMEQRIQA